MKIDLLTLLICLSLAGLSKEKPSVSRFDFGSEKTKKGWTQVTLSTLYSAEKGFGLFPSGVIISGKSKQNDPVTGDFIESQKPFYFVIDLPEGHYQLTLTLGGSTKGSSTTVKAESRRLMFENVKVNSGETVQKTIVVNVRTPKINDQEQIKLKARELPYLNWDNKLTLEFNGENPCVSAIKIQKANDLPTIFLSGN